MELGTGAVSDGDGATGVMIGTTTTRFTTITGTTHAPTHSITATIITSRGGERGVAHNVNRGAERGGEENRGNIGGRGGEENRGNIGGRGGEENRTFNDSRSARGFGEQRGESRAGSSAFGGYNHGGDSRGFSSRGQSSFGGGGGGFHGGGGGGGRHR